MQSQIEKQISKSDQMEKIIIDCISGGLKYRILIREKCWGPTLLKVFAMLLLIVSVFIRAAFTGTDTVTWLC